MFSSPRFPLPSLGKVRVRGVRTDVVEGAVTVPVLLVRSEGVAGEGVIGNGSVELVSGSIEHILSPLITLFAPSPWLAKTSSESKPA